MTKQFIVSTKYTVENELGLDTSRGENKSP